jgi:hypothetical protein
MEKNETSLDKKIEQKDESITIVIYINYNNAFIH